MITKQEKLLRINGYGKKYQENWATVFIHFPPTPGFMQIVFRLQVGKYHIFTVVYRSHMYYIFSMNTEKKQIWTIDHH